MKNKNVKLKTIKEISEAFNAQKEMAIWRAMDNSCVDVYQRRNWESMLIWDMSQYYFTIRKEVPEYCAFKTVEEVEPFYGQVVTRHTGESLPISLMLTGAEELSDGDILIHMGSSSYSTGYAVHNFKFTKTGKPVGIEVK